MNYNVTKSHLLDLIRRDEADLDKYRKSSQPNQFAIQRRENIHRTVREFINLADLIHHDKPQSYIDAIDVIRKQALIIKAAGITYPTINQSLSHIQDIYFASTNQIYKIGSAQTDPITIEII